MNLRASDAGERARIATFPQPGGNGGPTVACRKRTMTTPFAIEDGRQSMFSRIRFHQPIARPPYLLLLHLMGTILKMVLAAAQIPSTQTQSRPMMNLVRIRRSPTRLPLPCFKHPSTRPEMLCIYCSRRLAGARTFSFKKMLKVL